MGAWVCIYEIMLSLYEKKKHSIYLELNIIIGF